MFNDLKLSPFTEEDNPKKVYVLTVSFMHGDADRYEDVDVYFKPKNKKHLINYVNEIEDIIEKYHDRKIDCRDVEKWGRDGIVGCENEDDFQKAPYDGYSQWHGTPQGWSCVYYDENQAKFGVEFVDSNEDLKDA